MKTYYVIRDLKIPVYFGIYDGDKENLVSVAVTIELALNFAPKGQITDDLSNNTVDYCAVCKKAMDVASGKVFNLLEKMVGTIYDGVKEDLQTGVFLRISAVKESGVPGLQCAGVRYSYTEDPEKFRQVL